MSERQTIVDVLVVAVAIHAALLLTLPEPRDRTATPLTTTIEVDAPPPPAPAPPPPPVPEPAKPAAPAPPPVAHHAAPVARAKPAPAVLTAQPDPSDGPLDLTNTIVAGSGTASGGAMASHGERAAPVPVASPSAPPVARPQPPPPPSVPAAVDHSTRAAVVGGPWRCPFPPDADRDNVDHAVVTLKLTIDASAALSNLEVKVDPGHGFARAAADCARARAWTPAHDPSGAPTEGTLTVNVHFER